MTGQWRCSKCGSLNDCDNDNTCPTCNDKAATYEANCGKWLANGNDAEEAGKSEKAEKCYQKAQYWLDRANKARGWQ